MATKNGDDGVVVAMSHGDKETEIMEVDMTGKTMDDDDVDAIIEEEEVDGNLIEMDDEDGMEKYIEEDLDGATMNYDDLVVEDDGESLSNGATVTTTTKEVVEEEDLVEEEPPQIQVVNKAAVAAAAANTNQAANGVAKVSVVKLAEKRSTESNGHVGDQVQGSAATRKPQPGAQDDDRPVSIPSDSDDEEEQRHAAQKKSSSAPVKVIASTTATSAAAALKQNGTSGSDEVHEIDSDKEDCVMLDDTPPKAPASAAPSRKTPTGRHPRDDYDDDIQEILDDPVPINSTTTIQPVSKKMKMSSGNSSSSSAANVLSQSHLAGLPADLSITAGTVSKDGGKFTFVDPKAILNSATPDVSNLLAGGGLTISQVTSGSSGASAPSHAVNSRATITPVHNSSGGGGGGVSSSSVSGGNNSSSGSNSNRTSLAAASAGNLMTGGLGNILLPALTDDMFVLEAPSFIVPYIYEKPAAENLKQIVDEMKRELDALKVKDDKPAKPVEEAKPVEIDEDEDEEEKKKEDEEKQKKRDKKGGKKGKNADDSWGESDESTDDDASDSETRTKVLIKDVDTKKIESILLPGATEQKMSVDGKPMTGSPDNYFESPLGQFFMSIGMSMVQEHVQADLLRMQKRKQQREGGKANVHLQTAINNLMNNLEASRKDNAPFKFPAKRCDFCSFKTESGLAMANHYEKPHLKGNVYKCNFCEFEARPAHDILYHMEAVHNMKSKLEKPLSYHQCANCPFEDNGKSKLARHTLACQKKFVPENNLLPAQDWDPPAKIPRVKPRHGLVGTATAYQAMAAQQQRIQAATGMLNKMNNVPATGGSAANQAHAAALTANALSLLTANAALLNNNVAMNLAGGGGGGKSRNKGNNNQMGGKNANRQSGGGGANAQNARTQQQMNALLLQNNFNQLAAVAAAAKSLGNTQLLQMASQAGMLPNAHGGLTIQQSNPGSANNKSSKGLQQPSISITPLPRQSSGMGGSGGGASSSTGMAGNSAGGGRGGGSSGAMDGIPSQLPKPGQHPSGGKSSFVICEICDGYIKDLDQLRNHMQTIHKVKIHPKMIYNRPPLNCQKCQYRFFTDQGLERHLLGSHGLVTSSMQEAANCGQDSGRCPICGKVYQWKLLNHVSRDHNMTLKPAHLSYKCTVCTATFGMYKQFETHVYSAHSTVAKKGDKKNSNSSSSAGGGGGGGGSGGGSSKSGGGESLLKPLKINDEITIIPQPPSKMSKPQTIEIE